MTERFRRKSISIILILCLVLTAVLSTAVLVAAESEAPAEPAEIEATTLVEAEPQEKEQTQDKPVAAEPAQNNTTVREQIPDNKVQKGQQNEEPVKEKPKKTLKVVKPRPITKKEIKKVKKYKGKNAKKIPVITYHRILKDSVKNSPEYVNDRYAISLSAFEEQMKWLKKKKYRTITCQELYLWHEGKIKLPKRSVLITLDDGHGASVENFAKVLKKKKMKGTVFIIGKSTCVPDCRNAISLKRVKQLKKKNKYINFQSHSYALHRPDAYLTETYESIMEDAAIQRNIFGFEYLAYPHGRQTAEMIRAYKDSGIRMAFTFGATRNGYATRTQDVYKIKRIEIKGDMTLKQFKKWCK